MVIQSSSFLICNVHYLYSWDPVFQPDGYEGTFAELSADIKNKISHRSRALAMLRKYLEVETESIKTYIKR